ncbi:unnamed protein product [Amaranthus hypochondriacus]
MKSSIAITLTRKTQSRVVCDWSYRLLSDGKQLDEVELFSAFVLRWCIEWKQSSIKSASNQYYNSPVSSTTSLNNNTTTYISTVQQHIMN